ncbi:MULTISPECIES: ATP-binding protein [unclassified Streptomyces]|uniref:ATP-binding protein n=1 Tax=unclassified Streptomyces TaxID=2593676 RepID=UPI002E2860BB|nr:ATP-binding protein [Streptomyces sp. NBC_00223]
MAPSFLQSRLDLACEPSAVRYARGHAEDTLRRWGIPVEAAFDALTVVAELVTNAVRHAGGAAEPFDPVQGQPKVRSCSLTMWIASSSLYIAVYDEDRSPPILRPLSDDAENGRGLRLVAGLSEGAWGFQLTADNRGKLVWSRLRLPVRHMSPVQPACEPVDGRPDTAHPRALDRSARPSKWSRASA